MTPATLTSVVGIDKPANVPPRQPLPRPVYDPTRPALKLGLDVHLEFIMAVVTHRWRCPHHEQKTGENPTARLTTLIGAAAHG